MIECRSSPRNRLYQRTRTIVSRYRIVAGVGDVDIAAAIDGDALRCAESRADRHIGRDVASAGAAIARVVFIDLAGFRLDEIDVAARVQCDALSGIFIRVDREIGTPYRPKQRTSGIPFLNSGAAGR